MSFRDASGLPLEQGDRVIVGLALGQSANGFIERTESVLNNPQTAPMIHVTVSFSFPALQNGVVPGVFKAAKPEPTIQ